ncbi:unnamed protein product [Schistocephalus solidus]|uniref:C2H2-type domain-containing protein n=1 Tax=Schistocephalus solidus TaxID=70667 RepID=A0A183SDH0_SCHSO|nr:unnamed protein product [Schistocephalus solidus]
MVRQLHDGMTARVTDNGTVCEALAVTYGKDSEDRGSNLRCQQDRRRQDQKSGTKLTTPGTNTVIAQALPTCPRCQRTFYSPIGLVGHLRRQCTNNPTIPPSTSNSASTPSDSPSLTPGISSITPTIIETTSQYSSPVTLTTTTTISDGESLLNYPHCNRTFTSCIGLVGHLRIHLTENGEPVPGAPTHSRDRRLHCPHCPRAFTRCIGLLGHILLHDNLRNTTGG